MKVLNVLEASYRGTLEEQDDTVVWISHALKGAGAQLDVLLRANAVNYASRAQKVTPLRFGDRSQKNAPQIARDIAGLIGKGVIVYAVEEDLAARGISRSELVEGVQTISNTNQPGLYDGYDHIWHW